MSRKEETRKYKMSDGDLIQLSDSVQDSANRDLTELANYGVDAATLTALEAARDAFDDNPSDHFLSGKMMMATENKNAKREELIFAIRQIADRARIKYGENSSGFKIFGVFMLTKQTDNELYRMGKSASLAATDLQPELASEGLTPALITDLDTLVTEFDSLIDLKDRAVRNRDVAVDTRIRLGNETYALLVNLAAKGKLCWEDVNEALYNDYILNPSSSSGTSHVVSGAVDAMSVVNASVTGITSGTMLSLENTGDEPLEFFFALTPTDTNGPMMISIPPHATEVHAAMALGYSEAEGRDRFNINNQGGMASGYVVMWE